MAKLVRVVQNQLNYLLVKASVGLNKGKLEPGAKIGV